MVVEEVGPVSYMIEAQDRSVHKRRVDHIHHRGENSSVPTRLKNSGDVMYCIMM